MAACSALDDDELTRRVKALAQVERKALFYVLIHLAEFDDRKLYADAGYSCLFYYCTKELGYSEDAAYRRIQAARCAHRLPRVFEVLREGEVHLTALGILAPHMTEENHLELLERAKGKSKREIDAMVAEFINRQSRRDVVHWLSPPPAMDRGRTDILPLSDRDVSADATPLLESNAPLASAERSETTGGRRDSDDAGLPTDIRPAPRINTQEPRRARISFDASDDFVARLERAKDFLRHKHPSGRLEDVLSEALEALFEKRDPERRMRRIAKRREQRARRQARLRGPISQ